MTTPEGVQQGMKASVSFRLDDRALQNLLESPEGDTGRYLAKSAVRVERAAKRKAPVDTGRLRASIAWRFERQPDSKLAVAIGSNVQYALIQEIRRRYLTGALGEELGRLAGAGGVSTEGPSA